MAVAITRQDVSVRDLRREAGRTRDAKAARRMLAIACVVEGQSREDAAKCCGMDRQTLRDWVHRFNADGLAGLANLPRQNGPKPRLSPEQEAVVAAWVEQGSDLARDGVVRWRCVDLRELPDAKRQSGIRREWGVGLHERTVGKPGKASALPVLRKLAFRRLSATLRYHSICFAVGTLGSSARSTRRATPRRRQVSEWVRGPCSGQPARNGPGQDRRGLVHGRGPRRPVGHADSRVGQAGHGMCQRL